MDWQAIKTEYITTKTSYRKLAAKYGVSATAIANKSKAENWLEQREQFLNKTFTKTVEVASKKQVDRMTRIMDASDRLLDKLEKAIDELDMHLTTHKVKTKVIEYHNYERPDKPTKEIIEEDEKLIEFTSIIDRKGLLAVTDALKNLKDIQMIKSELDRQEQEAKIAKLRKEAEEEDKTSEVAIIIEGGEDSWAE